MSILIFALFGLLSLVGGFTVLFRSRRILRQSDFSAWRPVRLAVILVGLMIGASQFYGVDFMVAYPYPLFHPQGNVVGFPFFVVFFDNSGRDFLGFPLSHLGVVGNAVFWGLTPHCLLAFCVWRREKDRKQVG